MKTKFNRRTLLRGSLGGAAMTVGLPFLDCFLDNNGKALAATGAPLPVRFGTWFWGLGFTPGRWVPAAVGPNYELSPELKLMEPVKQYINVLSGFDVQLDGRPNTTHYSGTMAIRQGIAPDSPDKSAMPTIDILIGEKIGMASRFRSLELAATGNPKDSYSRRGVSGVNPAEGSPLAFYKRVFGPEFQDPNATDFHADPNLALRLSVLSAVKDDRDALMKVVGAHDKARLDEYFTSLRQVEQQLELQQQKPPPAEACQVPAAPKETPVGYDIDTVHANHGLMSKLLAMALACNQTKVFNMLYSDSGSSLHKGGDVQTHHTYTHEELIDEKLGYQVQASWFLGRSFEAWGQFVSALAEIKEGDGTLLDNCLVLAHSDCSLAKVHSLQGVPVMTAGKAGGRLRTGIHVAGNGDSISRVGLTLQQAMGLPVDRWGGGIMDTNKPISQIQV
jgi:Protein of unknown function (DUF1552)